MLTIKLYLADSGSVASIDKDFPLYQGQYANVLLNVFVPTTLLSPNFKVEAGEGQYDGVITPFVAGTAVKIACRSTARNGQYRTSQNYYMRYVKTLQKSGVEYALFERKLPKEFTFYAGEALSAPKIIANVVNISLGEINEQTTTAVCSDGSYISINFPILKQHFLATEATYTFNYVYNDDTVYFNGEPAIDTEDYGIAYNGTASGDYTITLSVKTTDSTITRVATTQEFAFPVLPSSNLDTDETADPSEIEEINAQIFGLTNNVADLMSEIALKQNITDQNLDTNSKTVVGAINELKVNVHENTLNISENSQDIEDIKAVIGTSEVYIGTYLYSATDINDLPTQEQLNQFVLQTAGRPVQGNDTVIVVQQLAGQSDHNYKYIYSIQTEAWSYYEIPPAEKASNGTYGTVAGTYGIAGKNMPFLLDIVGGEIQNIYIKNYNNTYDNLQTFVNYYAETINEMFFGGAIVSRADHARLDWDGNVITSTYQTKAEGATKQYVKERYLPKQFNDTLYFHADSIDTTAPTGDSPVSVTTSAIGENLLYEGEYTLEDIKFQLANKNSFSAELFLSASADEIVSVTTVANIRKVGEVSDTPIASVTLPAELTTTGVSLQVNSNMNLIESEKVYTLEQGDKIIFQVYIFRSISTSRTFEMRVDYIQPSRANLNTSGIVLITQSGLMGEIPLYTCTQVNTITGGIEIVVPTDHAITESTLARFVLPSLSAYDEDTSVYFSYDGIGEHKILTYYSSNTATIKELRQVGRMSGGSISNYSFIGYLTNVDTEPSIFVTMDNLSAYSEKPTISAISSPVTYISNNQRYKATNLTSATFEFSSAPTEDFICSIEFSANSAIPAELSWNASPSIYSTGDDCTNGDFVPIAGAGIYYTWVLWYAGGKYQGVVRRSL